jgi:hypothetical protein
LLTVNCNGAKLGTYQFAGICSSAVTAMLNRWKIMRYANGNAIHPRPLVCARVSNVLAGGRQPNIIFPA